MLAIQVEAQGEGVWPDLAKNEKRVIEVRDGTFGIVGLSGEMTDGSPGVVLRTNLPNGYVVLSVMSMRLLLRAADALRARYKEEL